MANVKITDLNQDNAPASTDVLPFVDVSSDETKKVTVEDLLESAGDGAAATPAFSFDSDKSVGMWRPGSEQLAFSTSGTTRLFINSSGNIGVNTSNPSAKLHVAGTARVGANDASDAVLEIGAGATGNRNAFIDFTGDTTYSDYGLRIQRDNSGANTSSRFLHRGTGDFRFVAQEAASIQFWTSNSQKAVIDSDGNVGIGNTDPGAKLQIEGTSDQLKLTYPSIASYIHEVHSNGDYSIAKDSSERLNINSAGNIGIGVSSARGNLHLHSSSATRVDLTNTATGTASGDGSTISIDGSSGALNIIQREAQPINFSTSNTQRAIIDSSGRLLVGTSSSSSNSAAVLQGNSAGSTAAGIIRLARGLSSPSDGGTLGSIAFTDSGHSTAAAITSQRDGGTWTSGSSQPTRLVFSTTADSGSSSTERVRITSTGNVGINTPNPVADFVVSNNGADGIELQPNFVANTNRITNYDRNGNSYTNFRLDAAQQEFLISGSEKARLDSSGRLLVQSSSAPTQGLYSQYAPLTVQGYIGSTTGNGILNIARGTTASNLSSGSDIGTVVFSDSAGGEFGRISCFADAAPGSSDYPGRISFHTTADGASSPTERMRISNAGVVTINSGFVTLNGSKVGGIQVTIADDAFAEITPPKAGAGFVAVTEGPDEIFPNGSVRGFVYCDWGNSPFVEIINAASAFEVSNQAAAPDGTTGNDAHATLFAGGTSGKVYLENRTGTTGIFALTFI